MEALQKARRRLTVPVIFLVFVLTPLIEIWLFLKVGAWIGIWPTLGTVIITAFAGVSLLRWQGISTLARARSKMGNHQLPAEEIGEGILLAIAGAVLLTPGFFTDLIGFLLLVPAVRVLVLSRFILPRIVAFRVNEYQSGDIIEGESYREEEKDSLGS